MEKKKTKQKSLIKRFSGYFLATLIISIVLFFVVVNIGIVYLISRSDIILLVLAISLPVFLVALILMIYITIRSVNSTFFDKILPRTSMNYHAIYNEKKVLDDYGLEQFVEMQDINESIRKINYLYQNINILNNFIDYSHIPLEYFSKEYHVITDESFKDNIKEIIACSQTFRNAVVQIDYEVQNAFDSESVKEVIKGINDVFKQAGILIALFGTRSGFYLYIPKVTAISSLKENLNRLFDFLTVTQKTINGTQLYSPKINAVIYPYSPITSIFNDLRYISSQEKRMNVYIPNRIAKQENDSLLHSTMNLNAMNKFISALSTIGRESLKTSSSLKEVSKVFEDLVSYLSLDEAGIVLYDDDSRKYQNVALVKASEYADSLYPSESAFPNELIKELEKYVDDDGTYYLSNREEINNPLGRMNDIYTVSSGFYYLCNVDQGKHRCLIYFVNSNNKPFILDSYIRECLLMVSSLVASILTVSASNNRLEIMKSREDNLYKITNILSYNVNRETYEILDCSTSLKETIPTIETGMKCYKAIFGTDEPCKDCPLKSRQKIIKEINGVRSEVSFSVNNKLNNQVELLVTPLEEGEGLHNRFEPDLGINSLYSLMNRIDNLFLTRTKGYVVMVQIDNQIQLTEVLGNEGYSMLYRLLAEEINTNVLRGNELYMFRNDAFIIVLPEIGKLDVVDIVEAIYGLSKKDFLHNEAERLEFKFVYSAVKFPQQFNNTEGLIRHFDQLLAKRDLKKLPSDTIYVEENDFYRPASRTKYILNIIDDAVLNNKFIIRAQPIVSGGTKHIDGCELLIRLSDTYRDSMLNTDELIKIAAKNEKLNLISDLLINFVCNSFKQYGDSLFRDNQFKHMSINADYAYFIQEKFYHKLKDILSENDIPKGFLVFEITEMDLAAHYKEFSSIVSDLSRIGCQVVCDRYTTQHLSLQQIKDLGIDTFKVDRSIVNDIDINSDKFTNISNLIKDAKAAEMKFCVVGVENGQQYKLLKAEDPNIKMQGYYFHHPLGINELVEALKH